MQQSHLRGVLSNRVAEVSATPIAPVQRAPFASARLNKPLFTRWIEAKTVRDWARFQVEGALYASEEEAVGHLLE